MNDQLQKISGDSDLIRGLGCGVLAALIMSYVGHVEKPELCKLRANDLSWLHK